MAPEPTRGPLRSVAYRVRPGAPGHRPRSQNAPVRSRDVWNVILGVVIATAGTIIVQVWVIPPVTRRSRQLDRWEDDVREIGSVISIQLSVARQDAYAAWSSWRSWRRVGLQRDIDPNDPTFADEDRVRSDAYRRAAQEYARVVTRLDLLASRIAARDSDHMPYLLLEFDVASLTLPPSVLFEWSEAGMKKMDEDWKQEAEYRKQLLKRIEVLSAEIAPPSPITWTMRARRRVRRWRRSIAKPFHRRESSESTPKP